MSGRGDGIGTGCPDVTSNVMPAPLVYDEVPSYGHVVLLPSHGHKHCAWLRDAARLPVPAVRHTFRATMRGGPIMGTGRSATAQYGLRRAERALLDGERWRQIRVGE